MGGCFNTYLSTDVQCIYPFTISLQLITFLTGEQDIFPKKVLVIVLEIYSLS